MRIVGLSSGDPGKLEVTLDQLNGNSVIFGLHFATPKEKLLLQE